MNENRYRGDVVPGTVGHTVAAMAVAALIFFGMRDAQAQQPDAAPQAKAAADDGPDMALSLRYRFSEKYGVAEEANQPELILQYQVGAVETYRVETEKPTGAPDRQEVTYRTIYTERPAKVGRLGEVVDAVRRYDSFRVVSAQASHARFSRLFQGLSLWLHLRNTNQAEFICLSKDRSLREEEYRRMVEETTFLRLMAVMPPQTRPVRIQDVWRIARPGALALLGDLPYLGDCQLEAKLIDVSKAPQGTALTAVIDITGEVELEQGTRNVPARTGTVDARITFVFEAPPAAPAVAAPPPGGEPPAEDRRRNAGVVDARGYIAKLQMARRFNVPLDREGRLQQTNTRELVLARRPVPAAGGGAVGPLDIPAPPPVADPANSWLLYDDPLGRYHFRHPQELRLHDSSEDQGVELISSLPNGMSDVLRIVTKAKAPDPDFDRATSSPQSFVKNLRDNWNLQNREIINGPLGWLADADWEPLRRKVYRFEVAMKIEDKNRFYLDAYLILFTRAGRFAVYAMTNRDNHVEFRDQAESILKTLDLGPSEPALVGAQERPLTSPTPAARPELEPTGSPPVGTARPAAGPRPAPRRIGPPPSIPERNPARGEPPVPE